MNNILKFRVWVKYVDGGEFLTYAQHINADGILINVHNGSSNIGVVQRITGLKDINNKDIYEGDILEYPQGFMYDKQLGKIQWNKEDCRFSFKSFEYKNVNWNIDQESLSKTRIIGNIFENPELLK